MAKRVRVNLIEYIKIARMINDGDKGIDKMAKDLGISRLEAFRKVGYIESAKEEKLSGYRIYEGMDELTFGQFVSIESMLSSSATDEQKMLHLACILIRPKDEPLFDNEDSDREEAHRLDILEIPFNKIIPYINNLVEGRREFHDRLFRDVFYQYSDEVEESEEEPAEGDYSFERKWYWYAMIDNLADGDVRRHSEIMDLNIMLIAPKVAYEVSKAKMEQERNRRQQAEASARARRN
ncbi:MAG: hypothetical protein ACXQTI_03715 [Candidatus Nezhaarchaeales archaeon]